MVPGTEDGLWMNKDRGLPTEALRVCFCIPVAIGGTRPDSLLRLSLRYRPSCRRADPAL
jgi:hypothetical protein